MVFGIDGAFIALGLPFLAAALAPILTKGLGHRAGWLLALFPFAMFLYFFDVSAQVAETGPVLASIPWIPTLSIDLSVYLDGLSTLFALLISGIGTFIIIYAGGYLKGHPDHGRFFSFMFLFMGAMLGLVIIDNLIALFVFWELTSITSFLLIGWDHRREAARRAALQALVITGGGGLALLAGFILIGVAVDRYSLAELIAGGSLADHPLYGWILILVLGGAFTKSAQFPLHVWLPNAMEAPTPVSAYLHSATMVKAGVYLLMRMHPMLGTTGAWTITLTLFGGVTLLVGTFLAIRATDLKQILAYTTVASLGLLVMLTGTSLDLAIKGAVLYLFAHSLFKGALFMVAGAIDHETGTRDITKLGGLRQAMPITFGAALAAAWSMGGLPLTVGFVGKETMYEGLLHGNAYAQTALGVSILGNALMFAAGFAVALIPFIGPKVETPKNAHEGPPSLWLGPAVLAFLGFATAIAGSWTASRLLDPMATAIIGTEQSVYLSPAVHFNVALALSALTIAIGVIVWLSLAQIRGVFARILDTIGWGPDIGFDQAIVGLLRFSSAATRIFQPGRLDIYLMVTFLLTALVLWWPLIAFDALPQWPADPKLTYYEYAVIGLAILGLIAVLNARSRLTAIVSLGIQGFAIALLFMLFGAPDLAFTQFMVETLSVVILALVMTRLNLAPSDHRPPFERLIDVPIAVACGAGFMMLLMSVTQRAFDSRLSEFFAEYSRTIAHGQNIVNVIIVDFRGLDTLGEIAVVMVAGLAILALLRIKTRVERGTGEGGS